jgi:omega-amidase
MSTFLKIGVLQYDVIWQNISENIRKAEKLIKRLPDATDLILLPEMFATGFTMEPELISSKEHKTVTNWMREISSNYNTAVAGSHPFLSNGKYFNRLFFFSNEAEINTFYDKRHLFSIGEEDQHYSQGKQRKVIEYHDWGIMPLVCYDLRFPVWSRNDLTYDLLFYSANWPASRNDVWETLLRARAIENQAYVIGVNRIGIDGRNISYLGNSQIISPKGEVIGTLTNQEDFLYAELDKEKLTEFRDKFPVLRDRDEYEIK